jgi:hypothetical protein
MSFSAVLALGLSLLGSLALLAHTIYRRPAAATPTPPQRRRFPVASSPGAVAVQEQLGTNTLGEVDAAYAAWLQSLSSAVDDRALAASTR